ncbi:MAG: hypothetical protein IJ634_06995 [Bacteroidales bacterium]|nr:hypothetical protein [Bacteroidales bacterium]
MQKLKLKQIDGVVAPDPKDDWSSLTDTLATAASTDARISEAVSGAIGGTLQSVTGGSAETGKYVSAVTKEGTAVKVAKTALPVTGVNTTNTAGTGTTTKAIVSLALTSGKVVATEKSIAFPNPPVLILDSVDFTAEITLTKPPYGDSAVGVFVNGLMQPPTDYTLADTKLTFKDPSHYAKGDTVNILYLTAA